MWLLRTVVIEQWRNYEILKFLNLKNNDVDEFLKLVKSHLLCKHTYF